jgi:hypothetical protein
VDPKGEGMKKLKYVGPSKLPKIVELPVPFLMKSEKTGEVRCNPVGEFPDDAAAHLLSTAAEYWQDVAEKVTKEKA